MLSSFYVTLQSNASLDLFPENKISDFKNRLGTRITFPPGKWEVALTDIGYTAGLAYIRKDEVLFRRKQTPNDIRELEIKSTSDATTAREFIEILNETLPSSVFKIEKNSVTYSIQLQNPYEVITTSDKVKDLLGLKSNVLTCSPGAYEWKEVCTEEEVEKISEKLRNSWVKM